MKTLRNRFWLLGAMAAMFMTVAPACDSPSAPPIEEEPKDDGEPEEGIRSSPSLYVIVHSSAH